MKKHPTPHAELAERWRVAGEILRRIDFAAFEALVHGAEVMAVESLENGEMQALINFPDKVC